jgi:hypothetical protein
MTELLKLSGDIQVGSIGNFRLARMLRPLPLILREKQIRGINTSSTSLTGVNSFLLLSTPQTNNFTFDVLQFLAYSQSYCFTRRDQ